MNGPVRIGVLGAGNVCDHYLPKLTAYPDLDVRIVADRHPDRAADRAQQFGIPRSGLVQDVLEDSEVEAVINLTPPAAHTETSLAAIAAGKHVYSEKPLAVDPLAARAIVDAAIAADVVVGSAPDVTLSPGFRAALRVLADGDIGAAVFARCEAVLAGPERWHPRPQFLYARGGGPLFDIGPYYLTALVSALGAITSVVADGTRVADHRHIGSGPHAGESFPVEVPTLIAAVLEFASGISGTLLLTFDSATHRGGSMEILGRSGTLRMPDPNGADPDASILGESGWEPVPAAGEFAALGPGVVNFARHLRGGEPLVADGRRAAHVVDVMAAIQDAAASGDRKAVTSTFAPTPQLPPQWNPRDATLSCSTAGTTTR